MRKTIVKTLIFGLVLLASSEALATIYIKTMPLKLLKKDEAAIAENTDSNKKIALEWVGSPTPANCEIRYRLSPSTTSKASEYNLPATPIPQSFGPLPFSTQTWGGLTNFIPQNYGMTGGVYYCIMVDKSNLNNISSEFTFYVESTQAPLKKLPVNGSVIETATPKFQWDKVIGVPYYFLFVSDRPITIKTTKDAQGKESVSITTPGGEPITPIYQAITADNNLVYGNPDPSGFFVNTSQESLLSGTTYTWEVLNCYASNPAFVSGAGLELPAEFTYSRPPNIPTPTLQKPANSKTTEITDEFITLEWLSNWNSSFDAVVNYRIFLYRVEESSDVNVAVLAWDGSTSNPFYDLNAEALLTNSLYNWKVVAEDATGKGKISSTYYFRYRKALGTFKVKARYFNEVSGSTEPVPMANVDMQAENGGSVNPYPLATGTGGDISLDLKPGVYSASVSKLGFESGRGVGTVLDGKTTEVTINIEKSPAYVSGIVREKTEEGNFLGISDASIKLVQRQSPYLEKSALTDQSGGFTISVKNSTSWDLAVYKVAYSSAAVYNVAITTGVKSVGEIIIIKNKNVISGVVINEEGYLIKGAQVQVKKGTLVWNMLTGDKGNYSFNVSDGSWVLTVTKDGFASPLPLTINVINGQTAVNQTVLSSQANRVIGNITDNRRTLPEAIVEAFTLSGVKKAAAVSDVYGQYTLNLSSGVFNLRVSKNGYSSPLPQQITLADFGKTITGLNFILVPNESKISGQVTVGGAGLEGVVVSNGPNSVTTRSDGTYELIVPDGSYIVTAFKEGYLSSGLKSVNVGVGGMVSGINFVMSPNASVIKGRVTSAEGSIYLANVYISTTSQGTALYSTLSDEFGQFVFSLANGNWFIRATKQGLTEQEIAVTVAPGQALSGADLLLELNLGYVTGKVTGTVTSSAYRNVNLEVQKAGQLITSGVTNVDGTFSFALEPGNYSLNLSKVGYSINPAYYDFTVTRGQTKLLPNFILTAFNYSINGTVTGPGGESVKEALIMVNGTEKPKTDINGKYRVGVNAGNYTLLPVKTGYKLPQGTSAQSVKIVTGSTATVITANFALEYNYSVIKGTIVSSGLPLAGVEVNLSGQVLVTPADGNYSFTLFPGTYTLLATRSGYQKAGVAEIYVGEGETKVVSELDLEPAERLLEGVVTDFLSGQGVAGVTVKVSKGAIEEFALTTSTGYYVIKGLAQGNWTIQVIKDNYIISSGTNSFSIGLSDARQDFVLESLSAQIEVEVLTGVQPLTDIRLVVDGEGSAQGYSGIVTYTGQKYIVSRLKSGNYTLKADKYGYRSAQRSAVAAGSAVTLSMERIVGSIRGTIREVITQDTRTVSGVTVRIQSAQGFALEKSTVTSDASGNYLFANLWPDSYKISVNKDLYISDPLSREVVITISSATASQLTGIDFKMTSTPVTKLSMNLPGDKLLSGSEYNLGVIAEDALGRAVNISQVQWLVSPSVAGDYSASTGKLNLKKGFIGKVKVKAVLESQTIEENINVVYQVLKSTQEAVLNDGESWQLVIPAGVDKHSTIVESEINLDKKEVSSARAVTGQYQVVSQSYDLLPNGFKFSAKVKMRLPVPATVDRSVISVGTWDSKKLKWVNLGGAVVGNSLELEVDHFSEYAILMSAKDFGIEAFTIQPNPFSPKVKPVGFSYRPNTKSAAWVQTTIKVYSIKGDLVKVVRERELQQAGLYKEWAGWDGTNEDGENCLNGRYLLHFLFDDGRDKEEFIKSVVLVK